MGKKESIGPVPYIYPVPITLVGTVVDGRANFMTIGDCGLMGIRPPLVYVSSHRDHHSNRGILEHQCYSVNFPTTAMLAETDYCGIVSGAKIDKSQLFEVFYGQLDGAPLIQACPVNLVCRVIKEFSIQHRQVFVAEVVETFVDEQFLAWDDDQARVDKVTRLDPILYALDNRYYRVGPPIGTGYQEGRKLLYEPD